MIVERRAGLPAELQTRALPEPLDEATAWAFDIPHALLALGSAQREHVADLAAAEAGGVDVVRRNTGGGAVLLLPGDCLWIDVLLPRGDRRWVDDITRSAHWLGDAWARAFRTLGVDTAVHRGGLGQTPWGRLVCFGAIGPGEVTIRGRKAIGISQRRTRAGARFQCLAYTRWDPEPLLDLLALDPVARAIAADDLATAACGVGVPLDELETAFLDALRES